MISLAKKSSAYRVITISDDSLQELADTVAEALEQKRQEGLSLDPFSVGATDEVVAGLDDPTTTKFMLEFERALPEEREKTRKLSLQAMFG